MKYRETFKVEPERVFDSDLRGEDIVILVIAIVAVLVAFFQPDDISGLAALFRGQL